VARKVHYILLLLSILLLSGSIKAQKRYFTILGEVNQPGTYELPDNGDMNILEALAQAGDMTVFGMRNRVLVVRANNKGKFRTKVLNLDKRAVINSPYYRLQSDDRIFVAPNEAKTKSASFGRKSTIWVSMVSTAVSVGGLVISKLKP